MLSDDSDESVNCHGPALYLVNGFKFDLKYVHPSLDKHFATTKLIRNKEQSVIQILIIFSK